MCRNACGVSFHSCSNQGKTHRMQEEFHCLCKFATGKYMVLHIVGQQCFKKVFHEKTDRKVS